MSHPFSLQGVLPTTHSRGLHLLVSSPFFWVVREIFCIDTYRVLNFFFLKLKVQLSFVVLYFNSYFYLTI